MSNQPDPFSNSLNIQTIRIIEELNLPIMQKQHIRILAHCLAVLKSISADNNSFSNNENSLKQWCNNQSRKFNDQKFSDLLYEQMALTSKKLNAFSKRIKKDVNDLDIKDLVLLVEEG